MVAEVLLVAETERLEELPRVLDEIALVELAKADVEVPLKLVDIEFEVEEAKLVLVLALERALKVAELLDDEELLVPDESESEIVWLAELLALMDMLEVSLATLEAVLPVIDAKEEDPLVLEETWLVEVAVEELWLVARAVEELVVDVDRSFDVLENALVLLVIDAREMDAVALEEV